MTRALVSKSMATRSSRVAQGGQGVGGRLDFVEKEDAARCQQRLAQQPFEFPADVR